MTAVDLVLDRLYKATKTTAGWKALCPAHPDRNPSLSISNGDGKVLLNCHAGCTPESVVGAIGLTMGDLFDEPIEPTRSRIVTTYPYHDADGVLLYEVIRKDPKDFRQRRPDGNGGYVWNLHGVDRVLYRLSAVIAAVAAGEVVYITEGEKDADALTAAGVCATTSPQGAGKWSKVADHAAQILDGAAVIVVYDQDAPGLAHAKDIARSLEDVATVTIAKPVGTFKDAADHLGAGHTVTELEPIAGDRFTKLPDLADWIDDRHDDRIIPPEWTPVDLTPAWRGDKPRPQANILHRSDGVVCFPPGIGYIFGDSGDGKSWVELIAALEQIRHGNDVVWLTYEDPNEDEIVHRLKLLGADEADLAHLHVIIGTEALTEGVWHVARLCRRTQATLLVIDSVGEVLAVEGVNEDRDNEFGPWARNTLREIYDRVTTDWDAAEESQSVESFTIKPIDHATKAKDNPHYASGSKRKRAMVTGLGVSVNVRQPFGVGQFGRIQLICAKDRSGRFRRGEIVAEITLDATITPYQWSVDPPKAGAEMTGTKKRNATERILEVIGDANVGVTAEEITRIANSDDYRMSGEAELVHGTVRNTLSKLTGVIKTKEPTGTGASYRITYAAESAQ